MNFAPYQDGSPELERAISPPPNDRKSSWTGTHTIDNRQKTKDSSSSFDVSLPDPSRFTSESSGHATQKSTSGAQERRNHMDAFETSLPMRLDYEAMMAYLLLPPVGGVLLLILEHRSDYVRFHAWQSSMLFTLIFVSMSTTYANLVLMFSQIVHLMISWSKVISWLIFSCDLILIGFLAWHAYKDVDNLDHFEVPVIGRLANSFVDDE